MPRRAGKLLAVAYNRPPAWRYLPPTDPPPQPLQQVADAMVETLLIPGAHHLALAVPHSIHGRSPYDFAINLISALYAREVPQRHVRGILVVGY